MQRANPQQIQLLRDGLAEAQMTVRAYDTKAQIVGVGYIFALGVVAQINEFLSPREFNSIGFVLLSWLVVVFPVFHFGHVLYPTRKTAPKLYKSEHETLEKVLYVSSGDFSSVEKLGVAIAKSDAVKEYCFELIKTSKLRELKRTRFLRGLASSPIAFFILFVSHIARTLS